MEQGYASAINADLAARKHALPPPDWTVAEHAEERRVLSRETSELHGPYRLDVTPYWREPLERYTRRDVEQITVVKGTQIGYSELMNCIVCYHIDLDPCGMIALWPTQGDTEDWIKDKWGPMLRDTPCLHGKVNDRHRKGGDNTTNTNIRFTGGMLTLVWSNSAAKLSQKSRRIIFVEEPDRCATDTKGEGTAIKIVIERGTAFSNRKVVMGGTPTQLGESAIMKEMETSDWAHYWIPCIHCGGYQALDWAMVAWEKAGGGDVAAIAHPIYGLDLPKTAHLVCRLCNQSIDNDQKIYALKEGRWVATRPFSGKAGYDISSLYSPMPQATLAHGVRRYLEAKVEADKGDFADMRVWTNTFCGRPYEEPAAEEFTEDSVSHLRERLGDRVPAQVKYLTAFADPGGHWTDLEVVGWGDDDETWGLLYHRIPVGMEDGKKDTAAMFADLDYYFFDLPFMHASGVPMRIEAVGIDTGAWTEDVYAWVRAKRREGRRVYACKGDDGFGRPWFKSSYNATKRVRLHITGVDEIKLVTMYRMQLRAKGPGYMHIDSEYPEEWEKQMTSNKLHRKYINGREVRFWKKRPFDRDEALDCRVGNMAVQRIAKRYLDGLPTLNDRPVHRFAPSEYQPPAAPSERASDSFVRTRRPGGWFQRPGS